MRRLSDPRVRLALGLAGVILSGCRIRRDEVAAGEQALFRRVNDLPDRLYPPAWLVMQAGTIGAAPVAAAAAAVAGRRSLAGRLLAGGTGTWLLAKVVKRVYRRPRPTALVARTHCRGQEATGLGYVSGHAGIATVLAVTAWPELGPVARAAAVVSVPVVAMSRMYVGAHLPFDILGGAALGLAVEGAIGIKAGQTPVPGRLSLGSSPVLFPVAAVRSLN
jgi:undecaprenyl-diphosphatase